MNFRFKGGFHLLFVGAEVSTFRLFTIIYQGQ